MKSNVKKIKNCKMKLMVEVDPERVERHFHGVLMEFQKAATIPGFRQGRSPLGMIEKKFAKEAEEEVLKSLIPEAYHQSIAIHKVSPVSLPSISDVKMERGKGLSFSAEFENAPEFSFKNYKGIRIQRTPTDVSPEDIEKGLQSLLESRAELVPVLAQRKIQKGDFIVTDVEIWQDGRYREGRKGVTLVVEPNDSDDFYEKVLGADVGQSVEISAKPKAGEGLNPAPAQLLYRVFIQSVQEKRLPEPNDEFAKIFKKESLQDLKEAVRKDIASYKQADSYEKMKQELFKKLLARASFEIPEGLVEKQKERLLEQARRQYEKAGLSLEGRTEAKQKAEADAVEKAQHQVRIYFILQKVAEIEEIEIDEIEFEQKLRSLAEEANRPLGEARRVFEEDLRHSLLEKKTIEFLLANAKLEEKE